MKTPGLVKTLALCSALAPAAGCISYTHHVTFEDDGSGRMVIDTWVPYSDDEGGTSAGGQGSSIDGGGAPADDGSLSDRFSDGLAPAFADLEGVAVEENWAEIKGRGNKRREHTHVVLTFDKIERLNGYGAFENVKMTFSKKGGKFAFKQVIRNELGDEDKKTARENEELARALFQDYTFTFSVVMPGEVVDNDGVVADDGRTVTWEVPTADVLFMKRGYIELKATSRED